MTTWDGLAVAEKSAARRLAELTETGLIIEDTVPTELSKMNVKWSPVDRADPPMLVEDIESCAVAEAPARNSSGLMLKTALSLSARAPAANIEIADKTVPTQTDLPNLVLRIESSPF
jgi:hypothetical protein